MKFRVRHLTRYHYEDPVDLASHILHLTPRDCGGQQVLATRLDVEPAPSRRVDGRDHFGNHLSWLSLDQSHQVFSVMAESIVEAFFPPPPPDKETPAWEEVVALARAGGGAAMEAAEYVFPSVMAPADPDAGRYVAVSFPPGRPVLAALRDLLARIRGEFKFRAGITDLHTPVSRVVAQKAGVCQDFSHMVIAGLRWLGLPARYVSGYIRTYPPPGQKRREGTDASHAWVGCWLGPAHGWVDIDPTNNLIVSDEHVVVGWGRDYDDVSPVRGIILGGGRHDMLVSVDLAPLEEEVT
ncbi:Transglutaminase-like enzymes, putative cysteine protease [Granulibacter bethesdensis]|uniref:Transglutaminase-like enzymes, putative cysteine protease n=1 Tax=Granulibacter bethesdensis TaxID=364410 RepID=A0AAN0VF48_9PROT|nr:transglutaminase family protein [Granulibacter bethesdensis]AHJ62293.1 Transglutaminase-like enzymes, putative cysteine protease [Granulibacter bethesdensis]